MVAGVAQGGGSADDFKNFLIWIISNGLENIAPLSGEHPNKRELYA